MEHLINRENVYRNIQKLLENENEIDKIVDELNAYHFSLKYPNIDDLKEKYKPYFRGLLETYSKIAFYILTRFTCFNYDKSICIAGYAIAAYCFEIIARNADIDKNDVEECKLLSAICYTLCNNSANSIVMAKKINHKKFHYYKLFFEREFKKIIYSKSNEEDSIELAIKRMAYALIYKDEFSEEIQNAKDVLDELKVNSPDEVYIFRLVEKSFEAMSENSLRNLNNLYPNLRPYINVLTRKMNVYELWESQKNICIQLNKILSKDKVSYLSMPTSSGKTLLAELVLYNYISTRHGVYLYVVPTIALENEIRGKLWKRFRNVDVKVSNGLAQDQFGNIIEPQIIVGTPEKIDILLRRKEELFNLIECVVLDEFHKISNNFRGWFQESLTIWLNSLRSKYKFKMILISAIADNLEETLNDRVTIVHEDNWMPTRKIYNKFVLDKKARVIYGPKSVKKNEVIEQKYNLIVKYSESKEYTIENVFSQMTYGKSNKDGKDTVKSDTKYDVAWKAVNVIKERPLMVYFFTKRDLDNFIKKSRNYHKGKDESIKIANSVSQILGSGHPLVQALKSGIAYHDGDLPNDVRIIVEQAYRDGIIDIIVCTTTLADGINMPAKSILIGNLYYRDFDNDEFFGVNYGDYKNIVGRIGRALTDTEGQVYLIDYPEYYDLKDDFNIYYNGATITSELESYIDQIDLDNVDNYIDYKKAIYNYQLLIYTLAEDEENFDYVEQFLDEEQILKSTDNKKYLNKKYGRKFFAEAKNMPAEELKLNIISGVSSVTNSVLKEIAASIDDSIDDIDKIITCDVYQRLLDCIEFVPKEKSVNHYKAFYAWINGGDFDSISNIIMENHTGKDAEKVVIAYIREVFQYIAPWMFGCLSAHLMDKQSIQELIEKLRSQVKYGTKDDDVISLCSKGINSRDLAIAISSIYHESNSEKNVIDWLLSVSDSILYNSLSVKFDVAILKQIAVVRRENNTRSSYFEKMKSIKCKIIIDDNYNETFNNNIEMLKIGELELIRNQNNPFNEYCVELYCNGVLVGLLPDIISEEMCGLLNAGEKFSCRFAEKRGNDIWIRIAIVEAII